MTPRSLTPLQLRQTVTRYRRPSERGLLAAFLGACLALAAFVGWWLS